MDRVEASQRLTRVFHKCFFDDEIVIEDTMTAADVDGWDSLSHVRLLLGVEDAFSIRVEGAEASNLKNIGELLDLILSKVA